MRYPMRLRNSLNRAKIFTVQDVLDLKPECFVEMKGVGANTLEDLAKLQAELADAMGQSLDVTANSDLGGDVEPQELAAHSKHSSNIVRPSYTSLAESLYMLASDATASPYSVSDKGRNIALYLGHYGVQDGKRYTLDELGRRYDITRERVRQVITRIERRTRHLLLSDPKYLPLAHSVASVIAQCLGRATLDDFCIMLQGEMGWHEAPSPSCIYALSELLKGSNYEFCLEDGQRVRHFSACNNLWENALERARQLATKIEKHQHFLDYTYELGESLANSCNQEFTDNILVPCCRASDGPVRLPKEYVRALLFSLDPCPLVGDNVLNYWWAMLRHCSSKTDAILAAIHIMGRPVHYSDLADFLCEHSHHFSQSDKRYIHTRLMSIDCFVCTGPGMYGLREWGVERRKTAADRVETYLRQLGRPATIHDIVMHLRSQGVPEANVRASLAQRRFIRHSDETIGLHEWEGKRKPYADRETRLEEVLLDNTYDDFIMG